MSTANPSAIDKETAGAVFSAATRHRVVRGAAAPWCSPTLGRSHFCWLRLFTFGRGYFRLGRLPGLPFAGGVHVAGFGKGEVEDAVDASGKFVVGGVYLAAEGGFDSVLDAAAFCVGHGTCREPNAPAVGEFAAERHPGATAGVGADNHDVGERFHYGDEVVGGAEA